MLLALALPLFAAVAAAAPCDDVARDDDVAWDGLGHDTFDPRYRDTFGAVPTDQGAVRLRLRTCAWDVTAVYARIWDGHAQAERWLPLVPERDEDDAVLGPITWWGADLEIPTAPTNLYYLFAVSDGEDTDYYVDDDVRFASGGWGEVSDSYNDQRSFQVAVYDAGFAIPAWLEGAVFYQIFPDRFRNGDPTNDPTEGEGFSYGYTAAPLAWTGGFGERCVGEDQQRATCYAGGDLAGITQELDGIAELGVTALYLNPIFRSATNHRYDTLDYTAIDDELGDAGDFAALVAAAEAREIHLVLDGVFNHVSADSVYFDLYSRWDRDGDLVSPDGPGVSDGSGACESPDSPYRGWFRIPDVGAPGRTADGAEVLCAARGGGEATYEAWGTYFHIPKLVVEAPAVQDWLWAGEGAVATRWLEAGARGWRLDVGPEVDPGQGLDGDNLAWEGFRAAVKAQDPDAVIIGEEWGDPSPWLLGGEWDSAMNYPLRSALLDWLSDGCVGDGCEDGHTFRDNDSNEWRPLGPITSIGEVRLQRRLMGQREDVPEPAWTGLMNLLGSHDVSRIGWLLRKISADDPAVAEQKLRLMALFVYTYPGAPTLYYGDEVGISADSHWTGSAWEDDPYNRAPYPWADQGGAPDPALRQWFVTLGELHGSSEALKRGGYVDLLADDAARALAFARTLGDEVVVAAFLRATTSTTVTVPLGGLLDDGVTLEDAIGGACVEVVDGAAAVPLDGLSGAVLQIADCTPDAGAEDDSSTGADGDDTGADEAAESGSGDSAAAARGCGRRAGLLLFLTAGLLSLQRRRPYSVGPPKADQM